MDMWFHFLVGILIQLFFLEFLPYTPWIWILILLSAFFSHFIIDWGSYLTFHPDETYKERYPEDNFYKARTVFSGLITAVVVIYFTFFQDPTFAFVMLASWLVDLIDWIIVRTLVKVKIIHQKFYHNGVIHPKINWLREHIVPWLPNWRERKKAYIMDFVLAIPLVIGLILLL